MSRHTEPRRYLRVSDGDNAWSIVASGPCEAGSCLHWFSTLGFCKIRKGCLEFSLTWVDGSPPFVGGTSAAELSSTSWLAKETLRTNDVLGFAGSASALASSCFPSSVGASPPPSPPRPESLMDEAPQTQGPIGSSSSSSAQERPLRRCSMQLSRS